MPQLYSRMDEMNWVTPAVGDILDHGSALPRGNGAIRKQMLMLQEMLGDLGTPCRVVNVRPTPSYTLFVTKPDIVQDGDERRIVTASEIKRSLAHIAENYKDWKLGFLPRLEEVRDAVGILLRTEDHTPISLRRLLVRSAFRSVQSSLALVVGNTLEQQLNVQDLADIGNLLMIGPDAPKRHFINSVFLTLSCLNTPAEMRIVIAGERSIAFKRFIRLPHALGRILTAPSEGKRLLEGMVKEIGRRRNWFAENGVADIDEYNEKLRKDDETPVPRIVLLMDSLSDEIWKETSDDWMPAVLEILEDAGQSGIHMILTASQETSSDVPDDLRNRLPIVVIARPVAISYTNQLENFHGSLLRFIDAVVIEGQEPTMTPVELCSISQEEVNKAVKYWTMIAQQRKDQAQTKVSGTTGVTGALPTIKPGDPPTTQTGILSPTNTIKTPSEQETEEVHVITDEEGKARSERTVIQQAQALAAYLGWIGVGPLEDILNLPNNEARKTLLVLKAMGIVEDNNSNVARFLRVGTMSPEE